MSAHCYHPIFMLSSLFFSSWEDKRPPADLFLSHSLQVLPQVFLFFLHIALTSLDKSPLLVLVLLLLHCKVIHLIL